MSQAINVYAINLSILLLKSSLFMSIVNLIRWATKFRIDKDIYQTHTPRTHTQKKRRQIVEAKEEPNRLCNDFDGYI